MEVVFICLCTRLNHNNKCSKLYFRVIITIFVSKINDNETSEDNSNAHGVLSRLDGAIRKPH